MLVAEQNQLEGLPHLALLGSHNLAHKVVGFMALDEPLQLEVPAVDSQLLVAAFQLFETLILDGLQHLG